MSWTVDFQGAVQSGVSPEYTNTLQTLLAYSQLASGDCSYVSGSAGGFLWACNNSTNLTLTSAQVSGSYVSNVTANGDIYAVNGSNGIYKMPAAGSTFTQVSTKAGRGLTISSTGDIYVAVCNGDIWKATTASLSFTAMGQTSRTWQGMFSGPNGDVYAVDSGTGIYRKLAAESVFSLWISTTALIVGGTYDQSTGDIYLVAISTAGYVYKVAAGTSVLSTAVGTTAARWGCFSSVSGDVYCDIQNSTTSGDVLKKPAGSSTFTSIGSYAQTRGYNGGCITPSGDIYLAAPSLGIYKIASGTSTSAQVLASSKDWWNMAIVSGVASNSTVIGNKFTVPGAPTTCRLLFLLYSADSSAALDIGTSGSNAVELYYSKDNNTTWSSSVALSSVINLGTNLYLYTTADLPMTGAASIGFKLQTFARPTCPNFRVYNVWALWNS